jgi:hypothetical protein
LAGRADEVGAHGGDGERGERGVQVGAGRLDVAGGVARGGVDERVGEGGSEGGRKGDSIREKLTYSQRFRPDQVVSAVTKVMMAVRRRMRRMKKKQAIVTVDLSFS